MGRKVKLVVIETKQVHKEIEELRKTESFIK